MPRSSNPLRAPCPTETPRLTRGACCGGADSYSASQTPDAGLFMSGTRGSLFATQLVTILIEIPWVAGMSAALFLTLRALGLLRVAAEEEIAGLDTSKHGGSAYPDAGLEPAPKYPIAYPGASATSSA